MTSATPTRACTSTFPAPLREHDARHHEGDGEGSSVGDSIRMKILPKTAMSVLGHDAKLTDELTNAGARPGLIVNEVMA